MRRSLALLFLLACRGTAGDLPLLDSGMEVPDGGAMTGGGSGGSGGGGGNTGGGAGGGDDAGTPDAGQPSAGRTFFESSVVPALNAKCSGCHTGGERFGFASLGSNADTNYARFRDLLSLDVPEQSRLLSKALDDPKHAGGVKLATTDAEYRTLLDWAKLEKSERCPACGPAAPKQYLAYVEAPALNWALAKDPMRADHGLRSRTRIMLQPLEPATMAPMGAAIEFLPQSFCGTDGRCDFGNLAASHGGDKLAFECRLELSPGKDWVNDVRWNLCIADIGADGRAVNPRFLLPASLRHEGDTIARTDPYGLYVNGKPLKGPYDQHFRYRRRDDKHPVFSPDDSRIYFSTKSPEPRGGDDGTTAYHGSDLRNHIVSVKLDGTDRRTIYVNEGGEADAPFFLENGNVAFHTWNLDRMDRHLYTQATADGMQEIPVLFGRIQGPNMWGKAVQLSNGVLFGMTGSRRASVDLFVPFSGDHTLGTGIDPRLQPYRTIDQAVFDQILPFPNGYCVAPPEGSSCFVDRFYADPAYSPDGKAFIAHNPEKTYVQQGEDLFLNYAGAPPLNDQLARLANYVPKRMGIWKIDHRGQLTRVLEPAMGKLLRYPEWVGARGAERVQASTVDESKSSADLHIADVRVWLSFRASEGTNKSVLMSAVDRITSLRVLVKDAKGTACLNDPRPYRFAVHAGGDDHPTALGLNNATGFKRLGLTDIPLSSDGSVSLRLPSNRLLLFQGVDAEGHVVLQHERLFALPPGVRVDTGVKRSQYRAQCSSCHGVLSGSETFVSLADAQNLPGGPLDFATIAASTPPIDLTAATVQDLSFAGALRPILEAKCVSCHSGASPAGQLSLERTFSATGNYPAGKWASGTLSNPAYLSFIPPANRVPAYNYSMAYSWVFKEDETEYKQSATWAPKIAAHAPLAELAPWDPAYVNLFANDGTRFIYLGSHLSPNFGRADKLNGNSSDAWLIEILSGRNIDPVRNIGGTPNHAAMLTPSELRTFEAVIDLGFPYMTRCDDKLAPSGPNAGKPWGDIEVGP